MQFSTIRHIFSYDYVGFNTTNRPCGGGWWCGIAKGIVVPMAVSTTKLVKGGED